MVLIDSVSFGCLMKMDAFEENRCCIVSNHSRYSIATNSHFVTHGNGRLTLNADDSIIASVIFV